MRAWQIEKHGEPSEALAIAEVPVPEPAAGEVRIRVEAAALGLPDVFMCRGTYAFRPELPFTPGQEVAGRVTACGDGASTKVGARVMAVTSFFRGHGGFAEETLALDAATYPVPTEMDAGDAAGFVIPYHTTHLALFERAALREGEGLLVISGASGLGTAAIQLGRACGARVYATAGGPEKVALCRELGAELAVDHRETNFAEAVLDHTSDVGAEVVLDLRSKAAFQNWHYPDALYLDFSDAMRAYPQFDSAEKYVLYCEFGIKSAHLAELMQSAGFDAHHFAGGLKQLIEYARTRGLATPEF